MTFEEAAPSPAPPGSEPESSSEQKDVKRFRLEMWRQQMIAQQNAFLTLAGLELTALTIYAAVNKDQITQLFFLPVVLVVMQVAMTVLLINAERETSWGSVLHLHYRGKGWEKRWRHWLIAIVLLAWVSIAALLIIGDKVNF